MDSVMTDGPRVSLSCSQNKSCISLMTGSSCIFDNGFHVKFTSRSHEATVDTDRGVLSAKCLEDVSKDNRSMRDNCDFRYWILVYYRQYNRGNPGEKKDSLTRLTGRHSRVATRIKISKSLRNDLQFGDRCSSDVWSQGMTKERGRKQKWLFRAQRHHAQANKKIRMIRNPRISELVRTRSVWLTRCQHFVEEFWNERTQRSRTWNRRVLNEDEFGVDKVHLIVLMSLTDELLLLLLRIMIFSVGAIRSDVQSVSWGWVIRELFDVIRR